MSGIVFESGFEGLFSVIAPTLHYFLKFPRPSMFSVAGKRSRPLRFYPAYSKLMNGCIISL